jgi:hypothetical protein
LFQVLWLIYKQESLTSSLKNEMNFVFLWMLASMNIYQPSANSLRNWKFKIGSIIINTINSILFPIPLETKSKKLLLRDKWKLEIIWRN